MKIHRKTGGLAATHAYLLIDDQTRQGVLIDAPFETLPGLLQIARQQECQIQALLLTHGHWDHISDHAVFNQAYPQAPVLIHRLDEPKLAFPQLQCELFGLPYEIPPRTPDAYLEDGQKYRVGSLELEVIFTPGHAPGHVSFYLASHDLLIGGDLLFAGSVGRTDLPDSDPSAMRVSLERVMKLPPQTRLLPGHGPESTLARERQTNPYLR